MLARYLMASCEGHLMIALKQLLGYLRKHPDGQILIDPNPMDHSEGLKKFTAYDNWCEFYPDAKEEMPPDQPIPRIKKAHITIYVDADHAQDQVTRRTVTGVILFVNGTPLRWISKRQKTVETSTYGSELVAARIAVKQTCDGISVLVENVRCRSRWPMHAVQWQHFSHSEHHHPKSATQEKAQRYRQPSSSWMCCSWDMSFFPHVDLVSNLADFLTKPLGAVAFWRVVKPGLFKATIWVEQENG